MPPLVIHKDTYEEDGIAYCRWNTYIFGIKVSSIVHTTTETSVIMKLTKNNKKQFNIKGFNK